MRRKRALPPLMAYAIIVMLLIAPIQGLGENETAPDENKEEKNMSVSKSTDTMNANKTETMTQEREDPTQGEATNQNQTMEVNKSPSNETTLPIPTNKDPQVTTSKTPIASEQADKDTIPKETVPENSAATQTDQESNKEENTHPVSIKEFSINDTTIEKSTNTTTQTQEAKEETPQEAEKSPQLQVFYEDGRKRFEIMTDAQVLEITTTEEKTPEGKRVTISSEEHVTTPLRIYASLETEAKEERIAIIWENEEKEVTEVEYYDDNNNGMIERVSWIVPHLSTQVFTIIIAANVTTVTNQSMISITATNPPTGLEQNPIEFSFNVSYKQTAVNCTLTIDSASYEGINLSMTSNLANGDHTWEYTCIDGLNSTVQETISGNFTINEGFSVTDKKAVYVRKLWGDNALLNANTITINSITGGTVSTTIDGPGGIPKTSIGTGSTPYLIPLNSTLITEQGTYVLEMDFERIENNITEVIYAATVNMDHPSTAAVGEEVTISININAQGIPIDTQVSEAIIHFGDGSIDNSYSGGTWENLNKNIKHTYATAGAYNVTVTFKLGTTPFIISREQKITVTAATDTTKPSITLLYPDDEDTISEEIIDFEFKGHDNQKIDVCNFSIYNATKTDSVTIYSEESLVYREKITSPQNNETLKISLTDFENRYYIWEVVCIDNSSNVNDEIAYFTYSNSNTSEQTFSINTDDQEYERKEEVRALIDAATTFIEKEETFTADEKRAIEHLRLMEDVKYYKKRLLDIEQTLARNLHFIQDKTLREQRRQETLEEIDTIKEKIPTAFIVEDTYEYVKNGLTLNWQEVTTAYLEATHTKVSTSTGAIAEYNKALQQDLGVSTTVKEINIRYFEAKDKEIVLVTKEVRIENASHEKLLEVIPPRLLKENTNITFLTPAEEIVKNQMYEIQVTDISEDEIVYIIEETINIQDLEDLDTILFTEHVSQRKFMTTLSGFLVLGSSPDAGAGGIGLVILLVLLLTFLGYWIMKTAQKASLKKNPNIYRIIDFIECIKKNLGEHNITDARANYQKIQEQYSVLAMKDKIRIFEKIQRAQIAIDRKEIFSLVDEYKKARNQFQKDDAMNLYDTIKKVYRRLPKKDQAQIINALNL